MTFLHRKPTLFHTYLTQTQVTFKEKKSHYTLVKIEKNYNTFYKSLVKIFHKLSSVKIFHKLSPIIVSTHKKSKNTKENGNANWPLSFNLCFFVSCVFVSMGARKWVTLGKFEYLRGLDFVVGEVWEQRGDVLEETWGILKQKQ